MTHYPLSYEFQGCTLWSDQEHYINYDDHQSQPEVCKFNFYSFLNLNMLNVGIINISTISSITIAMSLKI